MPDYVLGVLIGMSVIALTWTVGSLILWIALRRQPPPTPLRARWVITVPLCFASGGCRIVYSDVRYIAIEGDSTLDVS